MCLSSPQIRLRSSGDTSYLTSQGGGGAAVLVSPVSADTCPCRKVPAYLYCLQMNIPAAVCGRCSAHTPPEGGVRTKKCYITFDTIFGRYLPRGTLIDGSQKCRMGAFCTIAKYSGEMLKKGLKTGQNAVNFFSALTHIE